MTPQQERRDELAPVEARVQAAARALDDFLGEAVDTITVHEAEWVELLDAEEARVRAVEEEAARMAKKLGSTVRENITKKLRSRGLTHAWEDELPSYQHERVRIWLMGSPAGDLIEAVYNESEDADKAIRQAVESDAADVLQQVRELVCA